MESDFTCHVCFIAPATELAISGPVRTPLCKGCIPRKLHEAQKDHYVCVIQSINKSVFSASEERRRKLKQAQEQAKLARSQKELEIDRRNHADEFVLRMRAQLQEARLELEEAKNEEDEDRIETAKANLRDAEEDLALARQRQRQASQTSELTITRSIQSDTEFDSLRSQYAAGMSKTCVPRTIEKDVVKEAIDLHRRMSKEQRDDSEQRDRFE